MSDVPIGQPPEPSVSAGRSEAMSTIGQGVARVGQSIGSAVAASASARSSVVDMLSNTADGVKDLGKQVDTFVTRHGKKFEDTLTRVAAALKDAQQASKGLGESLGSVGQGYERYGASREQTAKAVEGARGNRPDHAVQAVPGAPAPTGHLPGSNRPTGNGGHVSRAAAGGDDYVINAQNVTVKGGGGGDGSGGAGDDNAGSKPNGGLGRTAQFAGLLTLGAGVRAAGNFVNTEAAQLRPQQTAFQRVGFGSIPRQQSYMRDYHAFGVSEFSAEDATGALNIGAARLGGTNFRMASLAPLQRASTDMSATQAAEAAAGVGSADVRTRLYQYGVSTRGMSHEERLMAAVRLAVGKQGGGELTERDYNMISTQGESAHSNLQMVFGGDESLMQAARDLAGQEAGITGLDAANPTLRSEVARDTAQREMANEMLNNIAGWAERRNVILTDIYGRIGRSNEILQSGFAALGMSSGLIQGGVGSVAANLFSGVAGAGMFHGAKRLLTGGGGSGAGLLSRAGSALGGAGSRAGGLLGRAGGLLGRAGGPIAGLFGAGTALTRGLTGRRDELEAAAVDLGLLSPQHERGWMEEIGASTKFTLRDFADALTFNTFDRVGLGDENNTSYRELKMHADAMREDVGDPPEGSAIRTSKPSSHVLGMKPRLRRALEQMFRDNPKLRLNSGYRSIEHQKRLWRDALKKYGDPEIADNWVARPGGSKHNSGEAADIGPRSEYDWIKRNASRYGLHLPMSHEPWHVEVSGSRSGKEMVDMNIASGGLAGKEDSAGQPEAEESGLGAFFSLGSVTSSEGDLIASLLGRGAGGGGAAPSEADTPTSAGASGADAGVAATASLAGDGNFSGSLAQRASGIARAAKQAGFRGNDLVTAVAIALGESSGNPRAHNPDASTGDNSYGLWQINMLGAMGPARRKAYGLSSNEELFNPNVNAQAAYDLYRNRGGFGDWSVYNRGTHTQYLDEARAGVNDVGDPATPGAGIDGAPRGGSVIMRGGNKTVQMFVTGQQDPRGLAESVRDILYEEDDFEMVGSS